MVEAERGGLRHYCAACGFSPRPTKREPRAVQNGETAVRVISTPSGNLVEQVRARLAALDVDIERLESLRRERRQLQRMLRAAESKR